MDGINITLYHLTVPIHLEGIKNNGGLVPGQEGGLSELQDDASMIKDSETKVRTYLVQGHTARWDTIFSHIYLLQR